jgi:hypothetical protein
MLTPERLAAIAAREAAATRGPWIVEHCDDGKVNRIAAFPEGFLNSVPHIVETDSGYYPPREPDAQFIAGARDDVPDLLAHAAELSSAVAELERSYAELWAKRDQEVADLQDEARRLRRALAEIADPVRGSNELHTRLRARAALELKPGQWPPDL